MIQFRPSSKYWITFRDPNYPCRCACHNPHGPVILHIVACCTDYSFGPVIGTYMGQADKDYEAFEIDGKNRDFRQRDFDHFTFEEIKD